MRVLIPDGESWFATQVVRGLAHDVGIHACVLSRHANSPVRYSRHCRQYEHIANVDQSAAFVACVAERAKALEIDVVLPIEMAIPVMSEHREILQQAGLRLPPLPCAKSYATARDKARFADFNHAHNLAHPRTCELTAAQWTESDLRSLAYPVLYKPSRAGNGIGIRRFDNADSLLAFIEQQAGVPAVVQEELPGQDIDCSVLCQDGELLAATVQEPLIPNKTEFRAADAVGFVRDEKALALASELLKRLRWSGVAHIDMRYDVNRDCVYLIEVNPRFWGSLLGSVRSGVNFPVLSCRVALNERWSELLLGGVSRYAGLRGYLRQWRSPSASPASRVRLRESQVSYFLADPGPEICEVVQALSRRR